MIRQNISSLVILWKNEENHRYRRLFFGILLGCIIVIIYANTRQLHRKVIGCNYSEINHKGLSTGTKGGPPYDTYIISMIDKRFNLTQRSLHDRIPLYFKIHHRQPVPHSDLRIRQGGDLNESSLLLTYVDLWREIGWKPVREFAENDWFFIFEDDVDIVPLVKIEKIYGKNQIQNNVSKSHQFLSDIIEQGLKLAKHEGLLYLGTCNPNYTDSSIDKQYLTDGITQYRHGVYYCSHAMAYTKWRARTLWSDYATSRFLHNEFSIDRIGRLWQIFSKTYPISLGTHIEWPEGKKHFGFFFQNRQRLNSTG